MARPTLALVSDASTPTHELEDAVVARYAVIGAIIGFVIVTVGITIAGTVGGLGFVPSLGLGAFVGAWSGVGFGFMLGATVPIGRALDVRSR